MNRLTHEQELLAETYIETIKEDSGACGIAVAAVDSQGNTLYQKFWGYRDKESKAPITPDTIYGIASCTKSFTALAIMQLVEKGAISLDDPISKYIPEFTNKNSKPVLIRHLLSHAGGFFPLPRIVVDQVAGDLGLVETEENDLAYNDQLAAEGVKRVASRLDEQIKEKGLNGDPGEYLSYCNDGFGLLSDIIRTQGGEGSYAAYLDKHILAPLEMFRSGCSFVKPVLDSDSATLYSTKDEDGQEKAHHDYHDNAFVLNGGGAMKSTINDLKKYLAMYLREGKALNGTRILSESGIRQMVKPRQPYGAFGSYGFGLSSKQVGSMTVTGHGGSLPGVSSNIAFTYDNDVAVVVLCNTSGVPVALISDAVMKMLNGDDPLPKRDIWKAYPLDNKTVKDLAGRYVSGEGTIIEFYEKEDGTAGLKDEKGNEKNFIPVSPRAGIVRGKYSDLYVRFIFNEERGLYAVAYGSRLIPKV